MLMAKGKATFLGAYDVKRSWLLDAGEVATKNVRMAPHDRNRAARGVRCLQGRPARGLAELGILAVISNG